MGVEERVWACLGRLHVPTGPPVCRWALGLHLVEPGQVSVRLLLLALLDSRLRWNDGGICGSAGLSFCPSKFIYRYDYLSRGKVLRLEGQSRSQGALRYLPTVMMAQAASASQSPECQEAPQNHGITWASHPTRGATTLTESEPISTSVPPQDPEIGQTDDHASIDAISNGSPSAQHDSAQDDSWWSTEDPWSRKIVLTLGVWRIDSETY